MHFSSPPALVLQMALTKGSRVADIGCGSGFHTFALTHIVGDTGRVYAIDIQEDVLTRLWHESRTKGIHNIETLWADVESTIPVKENFFDGAVLSNVLFQLEHKDKALKEIKRILKTDGKLLVVDWHDSFDGIGPHKDAVVEKPVVETLLSNAGFSKVKECVSGPHHYALLYTNT